MGKLMVYGTTSSAGKSLITTGLCRIFSNRGYSVTPFKSQNMSREFVELDDGKRISTAQFLQAKAAGIETSEKINPVLLVPETDTGSDVYFLGEKIGTVDAKNYKLYKKDLKDKIEKIFKELESEYDIVIIEGAGSPAEINLIENDFVNTGMAEIADTNAVLVVDIDRGGAFAHLYGTVMLLDEASRKRIKGFIINKFRGEKSLLDDGIKRIEELTNIPVLGILDYHGYNLPEEDSLKEGIKDTLNDKELDAEIDNIARDIEASLNMEKLAEIMGL